jgi:hypothetical protein
LSQDDERARYSNGHIHGTGRKPSHAARVTRAAAMNRRSLQVEDEESFPDWRAEEAVVL